VLIGYIVFAIAEILGSPRINYCFYHAKGFILGHPFEINRHEQYGHLAVGYFPPVCGQLHQRES